MCIRDRLREAQVSNGVEWSIDHAQVGGGYAVPSPAAHDSVAWGSGHGLSFETTYTGKCAAALRSDLARGRARGTVLLWNTHAETDVSRYIEEGWRESLPPPLRQWIRGHHAEV